MPVATLHRELPLFLACTGMALLGTLWLHETTDVLDRVSDDPHVLAPMQLGEGPMPIHRVPDPREALEGGGRFREERGAGSEAAQLAAIGYVSGTREAGEESSVVLHDRDRAFQGLNLYTSGHSAQAVLMDMDGREVHRWERSFYDTWPDWAGPPNENMLFWRKVTLLPDGGLYVIFEGLGLVRLDSASNVVWSRPNAAHHDLELLDDGTLWVLLRRVEAAEELEANRPSLVDYVVHLDADGNEIERVSLLSAYANSNFARHYRQRANAGGDSFHTNALRRIGPGHEPPFSEGNLLVSIRHLDALAVVHPRSGRVVWSRKGDWRLQHDPHLLPNGNLLLFDNGPPARKASRILEVAPRGDGEIVWSYEGTEDEPFWSATCGTVQRLGNGNTLITESDGGRAFEVTPEGEAVWEFVNPHRPPDRPEFVATLFEVERLPVDLDLGWLPAREGP